MRGANLKIKKSWRGVGGEGAAPSPQMHRSLLVVGCWSFVVASWVFVLLVGGCCCCCCFLGLRIVLGRSVAMRGGNLKI